MNFSILNPFFLWLLPLSLTPIIFHLFFRFRRKAVKFPSFMFFHMIDEKFSERRKLREYLILLARIFFLIFFLLALAQVIRLGSGGTNTRQAIVLLIDNSSSMGVSSDGNRSKLEMAQEVANAIVADLKDGDQVAVVLTVNDPTLSLPGECIKDKKLLKSSIDSISITEAESNIPEAMIRAFSILHNAYATHYEIHVFSDVQEHEWKKSSLDQNASFPNMEIFIHRLVSPKQRNGNVCISSMNFLQKHFIINRSMGLEVTLSNTSGEDASVQLNFEDDSGGGKAEQILVSKSGEKVLSYVVTPKTQGLHWVRLKIEGDSFSGDNQAVLAYLCSDREKVLICGQDKDLGALPLAISPDGNGMLSGLMIVSISKEDLVRAISDESPIMVAITWDNLSQLNQATLVSLEKYIIGGATLLIFPGLEQKTPISLALWLNAGIQKTQGEIKSILTSSQKNRQSESLGFPTMILDAKSPFWLGLKDERGNIILQDIIVYSYNTLILKGAYSNLLGLEDGRILFAFRPMGKGNIFLSGINFSSQSSNIPLKIGFLPFIHKIALSNENTDRLIARISAGSGNIGKTTEGVIHIQSMMGAPLDWKGTGKIVFPKTGIYSISQARDNTLLSYLSVSSSPREGFEKFILGDNIPMLEGYKYNVANFNDASSVVKQFKQRRSGFTYFIPFLFLALVMLLLESLMENHGKSRFGVALSRGPRQSIGNRGESHVSQTFALIPATMIQWHMNFSPVLSLVCISMIAGVLYLSWKQLHERLSHRKVLMIIVPRIIILFLIMMAFFDPTLITEKSSFLQKKFIILLDRSSSMDVKDKNSISRYQRGKKLLKTISEGLPSGIKTEFLEFDTQVWESGKIFKDKALEKEDMQNIKLGERGTDLAGIVAAMNERSDISSSYGILMLTDGGDEEVEIPNYPVVPLHIVGIGNLNAEYDDLAIDTLKYPSESEVDVDFEIVADISANFSSGIPKEAFPIEISLVRKNGDKWENCEKKKYNMISNKARVLFRLKEKVAETVKYRLSVNGMNQELSLLNNIREFNINIHKRSLHILYFTGKLGVNFKMIRNELARDPGISFTALIRTMKDNFIVQGDRITGDEQLTSGFPDELSVLKLYDNIIIDSFPAELWRVEQALALKKHIEDGGSAIFLGGEYSFSDGGYAASPLSPLFPWKLRDEGLGLERGIFPVTISEKASSHPLVSGIREILSEVNDPTIESINLPGELKVSAEAIMNADYKGSKIPFIAIHSYGQGQVMGVATNTLWKWATRSGNLHDAYSIFWRQGVRNLVEKDFGGRSFSVKWDKNFYRPGEAASAIIRGTKQKNTEIQRLVASLAHAEKTMQIPAEKIVGENNAYSVKFLFRNRGEYKFRLTVYSEEGTSENYEKTFSVTSMLSEGADLGLDENFLTKMAENGGGRYYSEEMIDNLLKDMGEKVFSSKTTVEISLIHKTPYFFFIILTLLIIEWSIRRKLNL